MEEARLLDAWAGFRVFEKPEWYRTKRYTPHKHLPNEHTMWSWIAYETGIKPRWFARALWGMEDIDAEWAASWGQLVNKRQKPTAQNSPLKEQVEDLLVEGLRENRDQNMSRLVRQLGNDEWIWARGLHRAGLLNQAADLVGMTKTPMNRDMIRKRLS